MFRLDIRNLIIFKRHESCVLRQNFEFEFPYKQYKDVILTSDNQV